MALGGTCPARGADSDRRSEREGGEAALRAATSRRGRRAGSPRPGSSISTATRQLEIVAPFYSTFVFDAKGRLARQGHGDEGRVYAPGVVADLDGDGVTEIVVGGNDGTVAAYDFGGGGLHLKAGWPASTCSGGQCPEARGHGGGRPRRRRPHRGRGDDHEHLVRPARRSSSSTAVPVQPRTRPRWPRYSAADARASTASATTATAPTARTSASGNIDDDPQLEIVVTYDNHQINVFNHDGTSVLASPWYTNRQSGHVGRPPRLGPVHPLARARRSRTTTTTCTPAPGRTCTRRCGCSGRPRRRRSPTSTATASNEVIGIPNAEKKEPYETQAYAFMVLDGAYGDGVRSARRHTGFETLPLTGKPAVRARRRLVPAERHPRSDRRRPRRRPPARDRRARSPTATSTPSARRASASGATTTPAARAKTFASEVVAADLNKDGTPELVFGTYAPEPQLGPPGRALRQAASSSTTLRLRHQGTTATASASRRRRRSRDLDGDGSSRSCSHLRPRHRRLPRPAARARLPAVADRPRQPAAQRRGLTS